MSEWNSIISVVGTLSGTIIGLVLGYWTSSKIESRRQKHEKEMEYQREIMKHTDDLIKPLYKYVQEVWGSLAVLRESVRDKSSIVKGMNMTDLVEETKNDLLKLKSFYRHNDTELSLLLPHPISPWVFSPIEEQIENIIIQVSKGKEPTEEFTLVINALMKYQKNLKKLLGFETETKLEDIYPFK